MWSNRNLKQAKTSKTFVFCKYQSVNEYLWINPSNISLKIIPMRRKSSITIILPVGFDPSLQSSQPPKQIKINHQTNKFVNFLNVFAALDLPWVYHRGDDSVYIWTLKERDIQNVWNYIDFSVWLAPLVTKTVIITIHQYCQGKIKKVFPFMLFFTPGPFESCPVKSSWIVGLQNTSRRRWGGIVKQLHLYWFIHCICICIYGLEKYKPETLRKNCSLTVSRF